MHKIDESRHSRRRSLYFAVVFNALMPDGIHNNPSVFACNFIFADTADFKDFGINKSFNYLAVVHSRSFG